MKGHVVTLNSFRRRRRALLSALTTVAAGGAAVAVLIVSGTGASAAQFMAYASRAMRSLLVDMARERLAKKRFADLIPLTLGAAAPDLGGTPEQLIALDDALARLGAADPRLMQVAELRVVMGMQVNEIADALGVSEPTVKRDWQRARAFLQEALGVSP